MKYASILFFFITMPVLSKTYTAFTYEHQNYQTDEDLNYDIDLDENCEIIDSRETVTQYWIKNSVKEKMGPMSKRYFGIKALQILSPTQLKFRFPALSGIDKIDPLKKYVLITAKKNGSTCKLTTRAFFKEGETRWTRDFTEVRGHYRKMFGKPVGLKQLELKLTSGEVIELGFKTRDFE